LNPERLARVRRVREIQERVLRAEWALAARAAADAAAEADRLQAVRVAAQSEYASSVLVGVLDARRMLQDDAAISRIDRQVDLARRRAAQAEEAAEERRRPWQAGRADAEAMRRLERRARDQARAVTESRARSAQDEAAGMRHSRTLHEQTEVHPGSASAFLVRPLQPSRRRPGAETGSAPSTETGFIE